MLGQQWELPDLLLPPKPIMSYQRKSQGLDQLATVLRPDQFPSGSHATEPPRIKCAPVCLTLQEECCFWVQRAGAVQENIEKLREQASRLREQTAQQWTAWAGTSSWSPGFWNVFSFLQVYIGVFQECFSEKHHFK